MLSFSVPSEDVVTEVVIESYALKQVVAIHSGMAVYWAGLVPRNWAHSGQSFPWLSKTLRVFGLDSIFVNVCGGNGLCSYEGQRDFWLRLLDPLLGFFGRLYHCRVLQCDLGPTVKPQSSHMS
ncbi:hypothetical protein TNCV_854881 [Trichonephila clavipes]|nr:hypothetical protein TNCV_854881 [Trichonephila clavipes]